MSDMTSQAGGPIDENLLHATIKLNTAIFAGVCGAIAGVSLLLLTLLSLAPGLQRPGHYLNLLGVFLPGYGVTPAGAWFGLLWGFALGALFGALTYRVYARGIRGRVIEHLATGRGNLQRAVVRLDSHALGLALGCVAAVGLVVSTNWLVLRGTAEESVNAALLGQYLPGYTVSTLGSLVGAVEAFIVAYAVCVLFASIYNAVADRREKRRAAR